MSQAVRFRLNIAGKVVVFILFLAVLIYGQAGRRQPLTEIGGTLVPVVATRETKTDEPIKVENLAIYENGVEQRIVNFRFDPSPAKIILLVDNSQTLRTDVAKMKDAVKEFAYEIYEGDQLFVAAYDEKAEIIQEWTDDAKKVETALETFRKKGNPFLFDALHDVHEQILRPLMPGTTKTAIVIISDGLDRGSKTGFDKVLSELQIANVAVYALQIEDRTGGAYRRDQPKPEAAIQKLTEGTGGKVLDFTDPQTAAKAVCDELRKNRYLLSYQSTGMASLDARRLFLTGDIGVSLRTKIAQPPALR